MGVLTTIAAIGLSAGSAVASIKQGKKATKAQRQANEAQRKTNQLKNRQAKRQFLRNFRQAQAAAITGAIAQGVGLESSGVQGTLSSERTQAKVGLKEFNEFDALGAEFTQAQNSLSKAQFKQGAFQSISSFAQSFASFSGNFGSGSSTPTVEPTQPGAPI